MLLQNSLPIAYASRTLSSSEQKYAQIEKELLAIVFACEKFHFFLYGREFTVHSDHKPLESLVKKEIDDVTPRLQRMFIYLLRYAQMEIVYKPGKELLVADCLSRASLNINNTSIITEDLKFMIHSISRNACQSKDNWEHYQKILKQDNFYSRIVEYVTNGWPGYHKLDEKSQIFFKFKDELHYENGLLFKDHRLIIPSLLQPVIAKLLHGPHMGIEKTLSRGNQQFFWPKMRGDIIDLVQNCRVCEKFTRNNQKEPLNQPAPPEYPFHRVGIDIYEYAGKNYLALIDAYSGYICTEFLKDKSIPTVTKALNVIFNHFGYPTTIRCDNNPKWIHIILKISLMKQTFKSSFQVLVIRKAMALLKKVWL